MAIANGTCVSFCNQPKAQFGYTSRESRRYMSLPEPVLRVNAMHLATLKESKTHFGLP